MPILDIGYRKWDGPRSPAWTRALVVAATGVSLVWQGNWTKRLLILLVMPSIIVGIMVGLFEQNLNSNVGRNVLLSAQQGEVRQILEAQGLAVDEIRDDPRKARRFVWTYLLFQLFRYPQAFGMILLLGLVTPKLISYDLSSRAYLLYLSRPLTPLEYVFGKAGVLYTLITLIAAVPALAIYVMGLFLSTDGNAFQQTWGIPLRILLATVCLILPTSAVALALSSLTRESRYASFAWFAMWLAGHIAYVSVLQAELMNQNDSVFLRSYSNLIYLSPYEFLAYLQRKVFGLLPESTPILMPFLVAGVVTVVGYGVAYWRVARTLKS
jgi:ABC-2 type transport system permease protein